MNYDIQKYILQQHTMVDYILKFPLNILDLETIIILLMINRFKGKKSNLFSNESHKLQYECFLKSCNIDIVRFRHPEPEQIESFGGLICPTDDYFGKVTEHIITRLTSMNSQDADKHCSYYPKRYVCFKCRIQHFIPCSFTLAMELDQRTRRFQISWWNNQHTHFFPSLTNLQAKQIYEEMIEMKRGRPEAFSKLISKQGAKIEHFKNSLQSQDFNLEISDEEDIEQKRKSSKHKIKQRKFSIILKKLTYKGPLHQGQQPKKERSVVSQDICYDFEEEIQNNQQYESDLENS